MSAVLSAVFGAGWQGLTNAGIVLSGGKIYTYTAGSTTAYPTWTDSTQGTQNANPIILNSAGRPPNEVWLQDGLSYKFILKDSSDNTLGTWDFIPGINQSTATLSEWVPGLTATYIGATQFSVPGNVVTTYQVHRRVQFNLVTGTFYGTISASVYNGTTLTTVTVLADSTGMDATLSSVNYGFMSATYYSVPIIFVPTNNPAMTGAVDMSAATSITGGGVIDFDGATSVLVPTAAAGDNSTNAASTAYVQIAALTPPVAAGVKLLNQRVFGGF